MTLKDLEIIDYSIYDEVIEELMDEHCKLKVEDESKRNETVGGIKVRKEIF